MPENNVSYELQRRLEETRRLVETRPLSKGGGGDNSDGMEPRIARLESDMNEVKADLKRALADLGYLRGKADSLPTTIQLIMFAIAIFAAAGITRFFGH